MKTYKNLEGYYNSTNGFVINNNLQVEAENCFGKAWEAEDDCNQIANLLKHINCEHLMVKFIVGKNQDDIEVCERKFKLSIDDLKDLKYKITQKLVKESLIKDCTNTDLEDEVNCENAIEEVFIDFLKFYYQ